MGILRWNQYLATWIFLDFGFWIRSWKRDGNFFIFPFSPSPPLSSEEVRELEINMCFGTNANEKEVKVLASEASFDSFHILGLHTAILFI